jgi:hypothetical protein
MTSVFILGYGVEPDCRPADYQEGGDGREPPNRFAEQCWNNGV